MSQPNLTFTFNWYKIDL